MVEPEPEYWPIINQSFVVVPASDSVLLLLFLTCHLSKFTFTEPIIGIKLKKFDANRQLGSTDLYLS